MKKWTESYLLTKINSECIIKKYIQPEEYFQNKDITTLSYFLATLFKLDILEKPLDIEELSPPIWVTTSNILLATHYSNY